MNIPAHQESVFYHYILSNPIFLNTTKPEFFTNQFVKDIFVIAKEYADKYKSAPSKEQISSLIHIKGLQETLTPDIVESLYNVRELLSQYSVDWLDKNIGSWIRVRNLDHTMRKAIAYMKTTSMNSENAGDVVETVRGMLTNETSIDFGFDMGSDFFNPESHKQSRLKRTSSGYDYIDLCLKGGYWDGSLIVFLSGPKAGKSTWLCNLAAKSVSTGQNTAYITLELQEEIVNMRIGANMLNLPIDDYETLAEDSDLIKTKINDLITNSLSPLGTLYVKEFPSSSTSANDIEAHLLKVQELSGKKFKNIFVDYLNIMKNWRNPNSENLYIKIKQISEDLRAMAMRNNWCVISCTQTNRTGWESSDLSILNISESAGLTHTVDVLFGIITNAEMKARGEYFLKCLLNRVAQYENTRKRYGIDWHHMRIEEDIHSPIQDMDFIVNHVVAGQQQPRGLRVSQSQIAVAATHGYETRIDDDVRSAELFNDNIK
jgi:hypothetical protein